MNILGLIPARGGSKGVPRKNIRLLCGKPLIAYTIEQALESELIDRVVVSTEDSEIAEIAEKYGAEVPFIRPKELAEDHVSDFPVVKHALLWFDNHDWKVDYIVFLRPCNLFHTSKEIDKAVEKMLGSDFDSIRGISRAAFPPYWMQRIVGERLVPFIESGYEETRRQELPEIYQINGSIEVIKGETVLKKRNIKRSIYGEKIGFIKMDDIANIDINTELDFKIVEFLFPCWQRDLT